MTDIILKEQAEYDFLTKQATTLAKSSLVPSAFRGKPADIYLAMKMGRELGLGDVQSLQSIHVIQGRPTVSAQTMIALIRKNFPDAYINIVSDCNGATCTMARSKEDKENAYVAHWNMKKAQGMNLTSKDNWRKQPENMMRWRAVSEAARFIFPDAIMNMYTPDETEDIVESEKEVDLSKEGAVEAHVVDGLKEDMDRMRAEQMPEGYDQIGPKYIPQKGKLEGQELGKLDPELILEEIERLEKAKPKRIWHDGLIYDLEQYLISINYEA